MFYHFTKINIIFDKQIIKIIRCIVSIYVMNKMISYVYFLIIWDFKKNLRRMQSIEIINYSTIFNSFLNMFFLYL